MNTDTGEIRDFLDKKTLTEFLAQNEGIWKEIIPDDMTEKQKENKQVSLKDHKSVLGKELTKSRKERRAERNKKCFENRSKFRLK